MTETEQHFQLLYGHRRLSIDGMEQIVKALQAARTARECANHPEHLALIEDAARDALALLDSPDGWDLYASLADRFS